MTIVTGDVDLERDRQLVGRCQAGDADAFGELYTLYHQRLVRHCAQRLGSDAQAEDVAQEAFIRAWRALDRFEVHRAFYPWLHVIASNACTDVLRRRRPTAPLSELVGTAEFDLGRGVEEQVTTNFDVALATGAMQQLSDRHRRVLHLREQLDWSVQMIAEHEGLEANAVDTLLWRARASLRRRFRALSEGAAAIFATGGTHYVAARNRLAHVVHHVDGSWGPTLRVRAAVAAVVVIMGVGAAATPLIWSPASPGRPASSVHDATPGITVSPGAARLPAAAGRNRSAGVTPGRTVPPAPGASTGLPGSSAGSGVGAPGQASTNQVTGAPPMVGVPGLPGAASTGSGAVQAVAGTVTGTVTGTVSGTVTGVAGSVGGTVGGVLTVTGGAVQSTLTNPTLPPVLQPVLQPVTGASTTANGATAPAGTGIAGSLLGLGAP